MTLLATLLPTTTACGLVADRDDDDEADRPLERRLVVPSKVGPYQLAMRRDLAKISTDLRRELLADADLKSIAEEVLVGTYVRGQQVFIYVGIEPVQDEVAAIRAYPAIQLGSFFAGAELGNPVRQSPGRLGGALSCLEKVPGSPDTVACAWVDPEAGLGMLIIPSDDVDLTRAAVATRSFRAAATRDRG